MENQSRESRPVHRTTYNTLGNPSSVPMGGSVAPPPLQSTQHPEVNINVQPSSSSLSNVPIIPPPIQRFSAVASVASSVRLIKKKEAEARKRLIELKMKKDEETDRLEDELLECEQNIKKQKALYEQLTSKSSPEELDVKRADHAKTIWNELLVEKEKLQIQIERANSRFERNASRINESLEADKDIIEAETGEQSLDEEEEKIVGSWKPAEDIVSVDEDAQAFKERIREVCTSEEKYISNRIQESNRRFFPHETISRPVIQDPIALLPAVPSSVVLEPPNPHPSAQIPTTGIQCPPQHFSVPTAAQVPSTTSAQDPVTALSNALTKALGNHSGPRADKKLPTFEQNPKDWLKFKGAFDRTKHRYDDAENMMRLEDALRGVAKRSVEHLMANPGNVDKIITLLEQRFGRPELVVEHLIDEARNSKAIDGKAESVVDFGTMVDGIITNITAFKLNSYLNDKHLVSVLLKKLPQNLQSEWYKWLVKDASRESTLTNLSEWFQPEIKAALLQVKPNFTKSQEKPKRNFGIHVAANESTEKEINAAKSERKCTFCKIAGHSMMMCGTFRSKGPQEKWDYVRKNSLCRICFNSNHHTDKCKGKVCPVAKCGKRHHSTLHLYPENNNQVPAPERAAEVEKVVNAAENIHVVSVKKKKSLDSCSKDEDNVYTILTVTKIGTLPILLVELLGANAKKVKIFALCDSGADFHMLEESVANELGLTGKKSTIKFSVFGDKRSALSTVVKLKIKGAFQKAKTYDLPEVHTVPKLGISGIDLDVDQLLRDYPYLRKMKASSLKNAVPQMIISYANYELFSSKQSLESPDLTGPSAYRCRLGWYVKMSNTQDPRSCHLACMNPDDMFHEEIKSFFSTENFGVLPVVNSEKSKQDKRALELLEANTILKGNRWETCLLWREDEPVLPYSRYMAINRLLAMERKMDADEEFAKLVEEKFDDYIKKGYLAPRSIKDVDSCPGAKKWFLPWFFVKHPTKKPRLVFDAAAKAENLSLNDFLLKGPDFLNKLPEVLTRFRRHKIALTADIKEMFHQVALREQDWPSQTILYRGKDRTKPPQEFYMTVLFFGSASSPCSAIFAKNKNAERFADIFPKAVEAIKEDFYMDDYLGGAENEDDAIELQKQLTDIHESGGFELVKWNSSSAKILESIPSEKKSDGAIAFQTKSDLITDKTLGLWWNPESDEFSFKLNFHRVPAEVSCCKEIPTKRQMTSIIMALFDPIGFIAQLKVKALMLIQEVWLSKVDWDERIPESVFSKWKEWMDLLKAVNDLRIPRKFHLLHEFSKITLHTFCDASREAYCAVVFAVFSNLTSSQCAFISAKARVGPIKTLSVPKMELMAAVLGTRLCQSVKKTLNCYEINSCVFWGDSELVLKQIRSETLRYDVFQANRIGEILTYTNVTDWKWVPSALNVADDGTRFSSDCDLSASSRWLTGAPFIVQRPEDWPTEKKLQTEFSEEDLGLLRVANATQEKIQEESTFTRCSSWPKLVRSTARCLLFVRKLKFSLNRRNERQTNSTKFYLTAEDLKKSKRYLFKQSQQESFPEEYQRLTEGKKIEKKSRLYTLSPALDENGIIILKGRIQEAPCLSNTVKFPPILDGRHPLAKLLILYYHEQCGHQGQEQVLHLLRQEAWIIGARPAVRRCWNDCFDCSVKRAQPSQQRMGQLPVARLGDRHIPFDHTGVDYFGPKNVTIGRKSYKRWGVLFTCLSTRAVHLELADSLDTSDMIQCLVRFMSFRGRPRHIWSDNGTNFVGANREILESFREKEEKQLAEIMELRGIQWHFIPPAAPHMGGSWERLVGSVGRILSQVLKEQTPKESTLRTLFAEISEILNNRPITYVSPDPNDPRCLTPNDFLRIGNELPPPQQSIPGNYGNADCFRKAWRHVQFLADQFWKRWIHEYLPMLAKRQKWHDPGKPLEVGDLVLVVNDQAPRSGWKKGIVTKIYPDREGQVRKVDVRVAHVDPEDKKKKVTVTFLHRPAVKICPLGVNVTVPDVTGRENVVAEEEFTNV